MMLRNSPFANCPSPLNPLQATKLRQFSAQGASAPSQGTETPKSSVTAAPIRVGSMSKQAVFRKHLNELRNKALGGGSAKAVAKHHEAGKLTARERIELLFDEGSFSEYDMYMEHRYKYENHRNIAVLVALENHVLARRSYPERGRP